MNTGMGWFWGGGHGNGKGGKKGKGRGDGGRVMEVTRKGVLQGNGGKGYGGRVARGERGEYEKEVTEYSVNRRCREG